MWLNAPLFVVQRQLSTLVNLLSVASLLYIANPTKLGQKAPENNKNISQSIMPDLETQRSNDIDHPTMRTDQTRSVGTVIADGKRLVDKRDKIIHSVNLHEGALVIDTVPSSVNFALLCAKGLGPAVSRLPAELLFEIFMHTLPSFDELLPLIKATISHAIDQDMPKMEGSCCGHAKFMVQTVGWVYEPPPQA
ncbi:hypothetical protein DFJ58DRAFT_724969 [Suillus subalutaceus]|uniref:uncharacterized protein n=1 Tax=Suillus subalutaceus TaxID=48586 RepID=UPI001B85F402|nr:uncharacterized protein DFJ58DRAFT_724969 [Suillus subalutaceus]KAG1863552.1 hypothetical protein DFJ58DRAFT_724969 [Suillus subalutaceus]